MFLLAINDKILFHIKANKKILAIPNTTQIDKRKIVVGFAKSPQGISVPIKNLITKNIEARAIK